MTTKLFSSLFAALALSACLAAPDDADSLTPDEQVSSESAAITNGWIGPFSEEHFVNSGVCGSDNVGINQAMCSGQYCDDISLYCKSLPPGITTADAQFYTLFVSEESSSDQVNHAFCQTGGPGTPVNGVAIGIHGIIGQYADSISLQCSTLATGKLASCGWTNWFSEESGTMAFGAGRYAVGVACRGDYCDEMRYYTCTLAK